MWLCFGFVAACCLFCVHSAPASPWPQFKRDASRTGNAAEETLQFPLRRVVAAKLPSPIYASPAVVEGKVYVQDARGHVTCVDVATNTVTWMTKIDGVTNMSSPAIAHERVYIGSSAGYLAILDAADGKLLKKVPGDSGVIASPAVANDAVYFSTVDGKLRKIDDTGKLIWQFDGGTRSHLEFAIQGDEILFPAGPAGDSFPVAIHRIKDAGEEPQLIATHKTKIYPTSGLFFDSQKRCGYQSWHAESGSVAFYELDDPSRFQQIAHPRWGEEIDSRAVPSARGDRFFCTHRTGLRCLRMQREGSKSRLELDWQSGGWPVYGPHGFNSSPALAGLHVVAGCDDGRVYFFRIAKDIDEKSGQPAPRQQAVWSFETVGAGKPNGSVTSPPAVSSGMVFFGGEDGILYGLGKGQLKEIVQVAAKNEPHPWPGRKLKGYPWPTARGGMGYHGVSPDTVLNPPLKIKWRTRIWGSSKGIVTVAAGRVFASSRNGQLNALDAETGEIIWRTSRPASNTFPPATYSDGKLFSFCRGIVYARKENFGGGVWCHDAETGELLWRKPNPIPTGDYDAAAGIVVHEKRVLLCWDAGDGSLMTGAYHTDTGEPIWELRTCFEIQFSVFSSRRDMRLVIAM